MNIHIKRLSTKVAVRWSKNFMNYKLDIHLVVGKYELNIWAFPTGWSNIGPRRGFIDYKLTTH